MLLHSHVQLDVGTGRHLLAHRGPADLLQPFAVVADDHALLRVAFDDDLDTHSRPLPHLHHPAGQGDGADSSRMWTSSCSRTNSATPERLGDIAHHVLGEIRRPWGEATEDFADQGLHPAPGGGRDGEELALRIQELIRLGQLANDDDVGEARSTLFTATGTRDAVAGGGALEDEAVAGPDRRRGGVDHGDHHIDVVEGIGHVLVQAPSEGRLWAMQSRGVDEHGLGPRSVQHPAHGAARCVGPRGGNGDLGAQNAVDQGGLAAHWAGR